MPTPDESREADLRDAIRACYAVFRGYRLAPKLGGYSADFCDDAPLRAESLHRLPASAFSVYQWKATTTWGGVEDFKHLLPRMLELAAAGTADADSPEVNPWLLFSRLEYNGWHRWPEAERASIAHYFDALWLSAIHRPLDDGPNVRCTDASAGAWLVAIACAHDDVGPFLTTWQTAIDDPDAGPRPAVHLATMITDHEPQLHRKRRLNWFTGRDAQAAQTLAWLGSDAVAASLEAAFFRGSEGPESTRISEGHDRLAEWRRWRPADARR